MTLFSFFWVPLFFIFWKALAPGGNAGSFWAAILGAITGIFQFVTGPLIYPGDFGFFRWLSGFVDIVFFPVLLPLGLCLVFLALGVFSGEVNFTSFILTWLVPLSILRAFSYGTLLDPLRLIMIPLLWTALAVAMPFFFRITRDERGIKLVFAVLAALALPFLGATSYWAFFGQKILLGYSFFLPVLVPFVLAVVLFYKKA